MVDVGETYNGPTTSRERLLFDDRQPTIPANKSEDWLQQSFIGYFLHVTWHFFQLVKISSWVKIILNILLNWI